MDYHGGIQIPTDDDALSDLHQEIGWAMFGRIEALGEASAWQFGDAIATNMVVAMLIGSHQPADQRSELERQLRAVGWRRFLDETTAIDFVHHASCWREFAEYGGQGLAPHGARALSISVAEREEQVKVLVSRCQRARQHGLLLVGQEYDFICEGVDARAGIDFGGTLSLEGIRLLARLPITAIRNAVSLGQLKPDENGRVNAEEAREWLGRRRDFRPSRWKDPSDDQWPFDPAKAATPDENGTVWLPRGADGSLFTPEYVVRPAKRTVALSITIGAKGSERQYSDFFDALSALAGMGVARWRRRNSAGNWGIVRARGSWVAVSKQDIDRQLQAKMAELT